MADPFTGCPPVNRAGFRCWLCRRWDSGRPMHLPNDETRSQ
jgi:hypothetical protein